MTGKLAIVIALGVLLLPSGQSKDPVLVQIPGTYTSTYPKLLHEVAPVYVATKDEAEPIQFDLKAVVDERGRVTGVVSPRLRPEFAALRESVQNAVSRWRFEPLRIWDRGGQASVPFIAELTIVLHFNSLPPNVLKRPGVFHYLPPPPSAAPRGLEPGVSIITGIVTSNWPQPESAFTYPGYMNALLSGDFGIWTDRLFREQLSVLAYAFSVASYFDPDPLESPARIRSPRINDPACRALVEKSGSVRLRMHSLLFTRRNLNRVVLGEYGDGDAGFADADVIVKSPAYRCDSPALEMLFASLNRLANNELEPK